MATLEKARRKLEARSARARHLVAEMRAADVSIARTCEEKARAIGDLLAVLGDPSVAQLEREYVSLVREGTQGATKEQIVAEIQEVARLAGELYTSAGEDGDEAKLGSNVSRSASSAAESRMPSSPSLPKRAETFGGFDQVRDTSQFDKS